MKLASGFWFNKTLSELNLAWNVNFFVYCGLQAKPTQIKYLMPRLEFAVFILVIFTLIEFEIIYFECHPMAAWLAK